MNSANGACVTFGRVWGILVKVLPLPVLVSLVNVCRPMDFLSFAALRRRLHLPLGSGDTDESVVRRCLYLAFLDLPSVEELEKKNTFHRLANAVEHVVQGNVRSVAYRGSYEYGLLIGHVQPSQSWKTVSATQQADDYVSMFEFERGKLMRSHCKCVTG